MASVASILTVSCLLILQTRVLSSPQYYNQQQFTYLQKPSLNGSQTYYYWLSKCFSFPNQCYYITNLPVATGADSADMPKNTEHPSNNITKPLVNGKKVNTMEANVHKASLPKHPKTCVDRLKNPHETDAIDTQVQAKVIIALLKLDLASKNFILEATEELFRKFREDMLAAMKPFTNLMEEMVCKALTEDHSIH